MYNAINKTWKQQNIGGKLVYPGESRPIEAHQVQEALKKGFDVPDYKPVRTKPLPAPEKQPQELSTEELIEMTVKDLKELMSEMTGPQLLGLEAAEKGAGDPRETLLKAIEKEISERGND